jgi:hypothetical protein
MFSSPGTKESLPVKLYCEDSRCRVEIRMGNTLLPGAGIKSILIIRMIVIIFFFHGCASQNAASLRSTEFKQIIDIIISENFDTLIFTIVGNQSLTHTEIKQTDPIGVLFIFPDTSLAVGNTYYQSPTNEIFRFVKADEVIENERRISRIFIALKKDTPYNIIPSDPQLQVVFKKTTVPSKNTDSSNKTAEKEAAQKLGPTNVPAATRLKSVTAKPHTESLTITINANGTVKSYKSFTIDKPPRIVFDLYNITSPFAGEQQIDLETKWVKQIRYFGHPEKLRLVLDTHKEYLSKFSSAPTNTGLQINVGKISENPQK